MRVLKLRSVLASATLGPVLFVEDSVYRPVGEVSSGIGSIDPPVGEERACGAVPDEHASAELFPDSQQLLFSIQQNKYLSSGTACPGRGERGPALSRPVSPHLSEFPPRELAPATVLQATFGPSVAAAS